MNKRKMPYLDSVLQISLVAYAAYVLSIKRIFNQ